MRLLLLVLLCVNFAQAMDVRCANDNETKTTFTPYDDGVATRYLVEWCINVNAESPPTSWMFGLKFYPTENYCVQSPKGLYPQGQVHSWFNEEFQVQGKCSYVCLSSTVDLIFKACYLLRNSFLVDNKERNITEKFIYIDNNYTETQLKKNVALVDVMHHDSENVTIVWHTGVPFQSCDFELSKKSNISSELVVVNVAADCAAPSQTHVECSMRLPPGEYHTELHLYAPWRHGVFRDQEFVRYQFHILPATEPTVMAAPAWPWALAAFVVVLVFGAVTCYACRSREARVLHKRVLREWLVQRNESSPVPTPVKIPQRHILMLYAREGPLAAKFCAALRDMLQEAPDTQVYDIFSPEVMAVAASGPHAWIRGMLQRNDVAVLLLQTPALAALYQQQLHDNDNTIKLQEPLLGRRVLYRAPQYGDTLLQYAVLLTAEAAHARSNYHKYYIATLSELPTEIFPQLVPYRRYLLPGGAPLLARDLCDVTPSQHSLNTLSAAAREFADLAQDNPDYLMEELMLLT